MQILFALLLVLGLSSERTKNNSSDFVSISQNGKSDCEPNEDILYNRRQVLDTLASKLNYLSVYYNVKHPRGYSVSQENFYNFFVYDLTDTTNTSENKSQCIQFRNNHIYHFSSLNYYFFYSNFCVLIDKKMYFFLAVNCKNYINTVNEVTNFVNVHFAANAQKDIIIKRIKEYRKYSLYYETDNMSSSLCE